MNIEPGASAAVKLGLAGAALPVLELFGVPLGLRVDQLLAGFFGSLSAMVLLNSVPSTGDTIAELVRTSMRRIMVSVTSAVTAGYLVPLTVAVLDLKTQGLDLAIAYAIGAAAQKILRATAERLSQAFTGKTPPTEEKEKP